MAKKVLFVESYFKTHKGMFMIEGSEFLESYEPDTNRISDDHKATIDVVCNSLKDVSGYDLSQMTHSEAPWLDAERWIASWCTLAILLLPKKPWKSITKGIGNMASKKGRAIIKSSENQSLRYVTLIQSYLNGLSNRIIVNINAGVD